MYNQFYYNEFSEKVYYHEEHNIRFEWMKSEDINFVKKSNSSLSPEYFEDILSNYKNNIFLGYNINSSEQFKGRMKTQCLVMVDGIICSLSLNFILSKGDIKLGNWTYTKENYLYLVNKLTPVEHLKKYKILGYKEFDKIKTKLVVECLSCGFVNDNTTIDNFIRERGCPICKKSRPCLEQSYVVNKLTEILPDGYSFLPFKYKSTVERNIEVVCKNNHKRTYSYSRIVEGIKCKICSIKESIDHDKHDNIIEEACGRSNTTLYSTFEYTNKDSPLNLVCNDCGYGSDGEWKTKYSLFVYSKISCTCVTKSKMATTIEYELKNKNILFVKEKRFPTCRNLRPLPFDYYINSGNIIIEADGKQHFDNSGKYGEGFSERLIRDKIKSEFAINNDFNFLRIRYDEDHTKALSSFLQYVEDNPECQVIQIYGELDLIPR